MENIQNTRRSKNRRSETCVFVYASKMARSKFDGLSGINQKPVGVFLVGNLETAIFGAKSYRSYRISPIAHSLSCKVMLRISIFFLLLAGCVSTVWAQGAKPPTTGIGIIYNRETVFNLKLTTNRGYSPGLEFGRLRTYYKTTFYHISFGEVKHPKEFRQSADPQVGRSFRPFVYGKQNNLLLVRGGWGVKRYFSEKAKQKGVAMGMSYSFGPTLGLLKPYYLAVRQEIDQSGRSRASLEKYSDANAEVFLDNTKILGAAPFTKGLGEVSPRLGGNVALALHMDWGAFDEFVKALEIGIMADIFPTKMPILVSSQNKQTFFNFFINLQLGKRR